MKVILRNVLAYEKRRRNIEILKYRSTDSQKGEFPFTIILLRYVEMYGEMRRLENA